MRYHFQIRVKIKGDHFDYGYFMRCDEDHADACMLKTACMIAKKRNVSIGDVTIRIVNRAPRANKTFGGIST